MKSDSKLYITIISPPGSGKTIGLTSLLSSNKINKQVKKLVAIRSERPPYNYEIICVDDKGCIIDKDITIVKDRFISNLINASLL